MPDQAAGSRRAKRTSVLSGLVQSLGTAGREPPLSRLRSLALPVIGGLLLACAGLAATLSPSLWADAVLVEDPADSGSWTVSWGDDPSPGTVQQAAQLRTMRGVVAGAAGLTVALGLLALLVLRRQGRRLRRTADRVHWTMGANRAHFAARAAGRGWRAGVVLVAAALAAGSGVPALLEATFPGTASLPSLGLTALAGLLIAAGLHLGNERRAGVEAVRSRPHPFEALLSSPTVVAAVGVAVLYGGGMLAHYTPPGGPGEARDLQVATVDLSAMTPEARAVAVASWIRETSAVVGTPGLASAGLVRGTGKTARVWVDCGDCFEGVLPLPIRTVAAEIHAVAPDTFTHLGMEVLEGRDFGREDRWEAGGVAVVSRSLAARHFERGEAVGRAIRFGDSDWLQVVGIVDDAGDVRDASDYAVYLPVSQALPERLEVLAAGVPTGARGLLSALPGHWPVGPVLTEPEVFRVAGWFREVVRGLGMVTLILVVTAVWTGVHGEVREQSYEVGLRRAVGARRIHLLRLFGATLVRRSLGALAVGAWLALFLLGGLQRVHGTVPLLDLEVWFRSAAPVLLVLAGASVVPFRAAIRTAPALELAREETA